MPALTISDSKFLAGAFRAAENLLLDSDDVAASGIAVIIESNKIWVSQPDCFIQRRQLLLKKWWRRLPHGSATSILRRPMGGVAPTQFRDMGLWLASVDGAGGRELHLSFASSKEETHAERICHDQTVHMPRARDKQRTCFSSAPSRSAAGESRSDFVHQDCVEVFETMSGLVELAEVSWFSALRLESFPSRTIPS